MKRARCTLAAAMAALAWAAPTWADDAHHPEKSPAKPAATAAAPAGAAAGPATTAKMQANVKKMQSQLDRIGKAKSEDERQRQLDEHMHTMRENMMMGKQLAGGGMACPMHEGGGMGMMGADHEAMMGRMQQMEKRMDMMEHMMKSAGSPGEKMPGMGKP